MRLGFVLLLMLGSSIGNAQTDTTKVRRSQWSIELDYSLASYTESGIIGFLVGWNNLHHSIQLGPHLAHHELFKHPNDWARFGLDVVYRWFPIRSNRRISPYLMYNLGYAFIGTDYTDRAFIDNQFVATDHATTSHSLAHHFGLGAQVHPYKGLYLNVGVAAGIGTYSENMEVRWAGSTNVVQSSSQSVFANTETAFLLRFGIGYRIGPGKKPCEHCPR